MCGILGHYRYDGGAPRPPEFPALVNALAHRGPDDSTYWEDDRFAFGHRRLSIIDLAGGRQPMATADGQIVVTFNGEIYNYIELRRELEQHGCVFKTGSDTEVLLHGYRLWREDLLPRLVGMFAFALADRPAQELFLARDRFGEKPLLYFEDQAGVTFASELGPLGLVAGSRRAVDQIALGRFLCLNYVPGDRTLMQGVRRVPPAHWRRYRPGGRIEEGVYWTPPAAADAQHVSMDDAVAELERRFDASVRLTLRSDVPVGLFLSSGIDSSLVARSAARAGRLARAFCLGFDDPRFSEVPGAAETARTLGIPLTPVMLTPGVFEDFFKIASHVDEPMADASALAVWTVAREAAAHVKVVLSGDGGDELFGGYLTHRASMWHGAVVTRLPMPFRRLLEWGADQVPPDEAKVSTAYKLARFLRVATRPAGEAHFSWNGSWVPSQAAMFVTDAGARDAALGTLRWMAHRHGLADRGPALADLQRADLGDYLPNDILVKSDRMAMAHGLEVRAPFLNGAVAEFALSLPASLKAGLFGHGKRVLRALAGATYGVGLARAKKQGFSVPIHAWLRGPARDLTQDLLSPASVARTGMLDAPQVERAVGDHMSGRRSYGFELWGLMLLVAWHRQQIAGQRAAYSSAMPERLSFDLVSRSS